MIDFPIPTVIGQEFVGGGIAYVWNGLGWVVKASTSSGEFVLKIGDRMTGALHIDAAEPSFIANKLTGAAGHAGFWGQTAGVARWLASLGNAMPESGGNTGSDLDFYRYGDDGSFLGTSLSLNRASGAATFVGTVRATGYGTRPGTAGPAGGNMFNINWSGSAAELWIDGTNLGAINIGGGAAGSYVLKAGDTMTGGLTAPGFTSTGELSSHTGIVRLSVDATRYLWWDGTNYTLGGSGSIWHTGNLNPAAYIPVSGGVVMTGILYHGSTAYYFNTDGALSANQIYGGNINGGGSLVMQGNITAAANIFAASTYYMAGGAVYMTWDGAQLVFSHNMICNNLITAYGGFAAGNLRSWQDPGGVPRVDFDNTAYTSIYSWAGGMHIRANGPSGSSFRVQTDGNITCFTEAYKPGGGMWINSSDARIKNVENEFTRGLPDILALRPVIYTFKGNDTNEPPTNYVGQPDPETVSREAPVVPYPNSNHYNSATAAKRYVGLIAQEVQAVMPEMITPRAAFIDGHAVPDLLDIDSSQLIYALINAVKTLSEEVNALKATRTT